MQDSSELKQILSSPKNILLTGHRNPDGDAIGACLSLKYLFQAMGHTVTVVLPSEYPKLFNWLHEIDDVLIYDIREDEVESKLSQLDVIFYLDFNSIDRIDKLGKKLLELERTTSVMIDHHLYPDNFPDYQYSDEQASSTCELVFDFIHDMGFEGGMTPEIAEALMVGIITDTGNFAYNIRPELFAKVAKILACEVDYSELQLKLFFAMDEKHLRLLGHALAKRMEVLPDFKTALIYLNKEDYKEFNIQRGDTEGIVNYLLKMEGIVFAAFITEQTGIVKLSLRSKRNFDVQSFATKYFNGGGHKNASGGSSRLTLEGTVKFFKSLLPEYHKELSNV